VNPIRTWLRSLTYPIWATWFVLTHRDPYRSRFEWTRPTLSFGLFRFDDDSDTGYYSLKLPFAFVYLWKSAYPVADDICDSWSIDVDLFGNRSICLHWRERYKYIALPWQLDWIETAHMDEAGRFVVFDHCPNGKHEYAFPLDKSPGLEWGEIPHTLPPQSFRFRYVTNRGELQETTATVRRVERRTWQWVLFKWLGRRVGWPFTRIGRKVSHDLDISFADEMGSERGSWKGGVIGSGCAWIPGEPVEAALRRYESRQNMTHGFCR